ncbi:MAG TPA: hypothetical protein VKM94_07925 [Blastocatellia bacterium]|nr:hypothetical protein [Blastocatellia bacterium]
MKRVAVLLLAVLGGLNFSYPQSDRNTGDDLLAMIERGRERVKKEHVEMLYGVVGTRRVKVGRRSYKEVPITGIVGREMALAVLEPDGRISVARAIKRDNSFEVLTPGFTLSMRRENGINSDIQCIQPAHARIVAVKYPVSNEGQRFGPGESVIEAVYTPYSHEIKTEDVVTRGLEVMNSFIDKAYAKLADRGVLSRAFPGRPVVKTIPREIVRVLLLNEHIDPSEFRSAEFAKPLAERVLTVIATNKEKAYAYSVSPAGARGLVQMIPSTYALIAGKYLEAGLRADFHAGMVDPVNAMMAQVLLCDSDWQAIESREHLSVDKCGPYLAAAYNGGVRRVLTILDHEKKEFMEDPDSNPRPTLTVSKKVPVKVRTRSGRTQKRYVTKTYTQQIFKNETSKYISQYHWINSYLMSRPAKPEQALKPKKSEEQ